MFYRSYKKYVFGVNIMQIIKVFRKPLIPSKHSNNKKALLVRVVRNLAPFRGGWCKDFRKHKKKKNATNRSAKVEPPPAAMASHVSASFSSSCSCFNLAHC